MVLGGPPAPCWLEVDLDAVEANVRWLRSTIGPATEIAAVVKAQAYGLGAEELGWAALRAGASRLAVARVREGVALRRAGVTAPILVLTAIVPSELELCCAQDLTPTVADPALVSDLCAMAGRLGRPQQVHLKVDTGLTRYGAEPETIVALARQVQQSPWLEAEGLFTHFASSDEPGLDYSREQLRRFEDIRTALASQGFRYAIHHAANSAGAIRLPEARLDLVRAGITLAGSPTSASVIAPSLQPAASLKATVARVYDVNRDATIGYGRTFRAARRMRAALVPIGYADGLPRALSNRGAMLIRGQRAPIVGRVSMDQCVVDISDIPGVLPGDAVVALGGQGRDAITLAELAEWSETIPHEVLCRIGMRVPRVYVRGGEVRRVLWLDEQRVD